MTFHREEVKGRNNLLVLMDRLMKDSLVSDITPIFVGKAYITAASFDRIWIVYWREMA